MNLNGNYLDLGSNVQEVLELKDLLVVLLQPKDYDSLDNIIGLGGKGEILWTVDGSRYSVSSFQRVFLTKNGYAIALDQDGLPFHVDAQSGRTELIEKKEPLWRRVDWRLFFFRMKRAIAHSTLKVSFLLSFEQVAKLLDKNIIWSYQKPRILKVPGVDKAILLYAFHEYRMACEAGSLAIVENSRFPRIVTDGFRILDLWRPAVRFLEGGRYVLCIKEIHDQGWPLYIIDTENFAFALIPVIIGHGYTIDEVSDGIKLHSFNKSEKKQFDSFSAAVFRYADLEWHYARKPKDIQRIFDRYDQKQLFASFPPLVVEK